MHFCEELCKNKPGRDGSPQLSRWRGQALRLSFLPRDGGIVVRLCSQSRETSTERSLYPVAVTHSFEKHF
jgi:hypothetical protein